jgi:RNA polymerase sigma-70 factor, ECF subfamily
VYAAVSIGETAVTGFKRFYQTNRDRLFGYLLRKTRDYHLAADITQESFTRYLERYDRHEPNVALLFTISRNLVVDNARGARGNVEFNEEIHDRVKGRDPALIREESQRVLIAMAQLEPEEADILALATGSNLSYKEISGLTGISEANIKVKIHRSRLKLKKLLTDDSL